ncbi:hypothetical protein CPC08DRAFT_265173 [Agrocybe pediades]|nr:hypothetical protein CPC08DRAFT_265173 [Agrocybe pediades]
MRCYGCWFLFRRRMDSFRVVSSSSFFFGSSPSLFGSLSIFPPPLTVIVFSTDKSGNVYHTIPSGLCTFFPSALFLLSLFLFFSHFRVLPFLFL